MSEDGLKNERSEQDPPLVADTIALNIQALINNWSPAVGLMAMIFLFSSKPDFGGPAWVSAFILDLLGEGPLLERIEWLLPFTDAYASWFAHFLEYGALAAAFYWGIRRQWPSIRRAALLAWGATLVYAVSDEVHQGFVPGRHPDLRDIATDAVGAAVALLLVVLVERFLRSKWRDNRTLPKRGRG